MSNYFGDLPLGASLSIPFNTTGGNGEGVTLTDTPVVKLYRDFSDTPVTTGGTSPVAPGVTIVLDVDGQVGSHVVQLVLTGGTYTAGDYRLVMTAGKADNVAQNGRVLGTFSIQSRYMRGTDNALLASGYTTPPTAASNATAVWANSTRTLTGVTFPATVAAPGDAMTLTSGERTNIATAVWGATTRTLSSFGSLVADIWAYTTRTLTAAADSAGVSTLLTRLGVPDGASISADIAAAKAVADAINTKTSNLPAIPASQGDVTGATTTITTAIAGKPSLAQIRADVERSGGMLEGVSLKTANLPSDPADNSEILAAIAAANPAGSGNIAVNHNTGGTDNLRLVDPNGNGVAADVTAYLTSEYASNPITATRRGQARTGNDGRWIAPMSLTAGGYTMVFADNGLVPKTATVTVA